MDNKSQFPLFLFYLIIALSVLLPLNKAAAAFGISPPSFSAEHLVPGAVYSQSIYLVRDDDSIDLPMKAELDLNPASIRSWITMNPGIEFIIPKGVKQFPITLTVRVPKDIALASYGGNIRFITNPPKTGQVTIAYGANLQLNLVVGEGVYQKFSIPFIRILDVEEGWDPRAIIRQNNEGNVPESLSGSTFEVRDQYDSVRLAFVQTKDNFPEISPFVQKEESVSFPIDTRLSKGQYFGIINLYQGNKLVASQKMAFNVFPAGTFSGPWGKLKNDLRLEEFGLYYVIGLLLVGYILIFSKNRKKKN